MHESRRNTNIQFIADTMVLQPGPPQSRPTQLPADGSIGCCGSQLYPSVGSPTGRRDPPCLVLYLPPGDDCHQDLASAGIPTSSPRSAIQDVSEGSPQLWSSGRSRDPSRTCIQGQFLPPLGSAFFSPADAFLPGTLPDERPQPGL